MIQLTLYYNAVTPRMHRVIRQLEENEVAVTLVDMRKDFFSYEQFLMILQEATSIKDIIKRTPHIVEWYESEEVQSLSLFELYLALEARPTYLTGYFFVSGQKISVGLNADTLTMFYPRSHRYQQIHDFLENEPDEVLVEI